MRSTPVIIALILIPLILSGQPSAVYSGQTVWDLPAMAEENIDIGLWALIAAKEFDPSIDIPSYLDRLDQKAAEIKLMLAGRNRDMDKFLATRMFIYQAGPWNENRPYAYDLDDPLGDKPGSRSLSTYMDTRLGNCVTMPLLFAALLERVDPELKFHAVIVPNHIFLRFYDRQTGDVWNVETTNEASPARNAWYVEQSDITQEAIESGLYLRDLSRKEFMGALIETMISHHRELGNYSKALEYADLFLEAYPDSDIGLVQKGALFSWLVYEIVEKARNEARSLSPDERTMARHYDQQAELYINKAFSLGWRPETDEEREAYLKIIEQEKSRRTEQ